VSTLCICIVFIPMFLLAGIAKFLFIPLAEAVVFAMLASYLLSRTLVPTLAKYWLRMHDSEARKVQGNALARLQGSFERGFERLREHYKGFCNWPCAPVHGSRRFSGMRGGDRSAGFSLGSLAGPRAGLLSERDGGQIKLHMRARTGHTHRGNGRALRRGGGDDSRGDPGLGGRQRGGQHRPTV